MKIALAQINPVVGDFNHNCDKIVKAVDQAKRLGCDLVVFSELALCGYPPQDLLERKTFLDDHDTALARIVESISGIGVICGVISRNIGESGKPLHNSAVLFEDGDILFTSHKKLLPAYDVFDETRYFESNSSGNLVSYKGMHLLITICEDIWNDKDVLQRQLYATDPVFDMVTVANETEKTIDLLINLSASPYHIGKIEQRQHVFIKICEKQKLALVYVNQVGGQDSLLFDGSSMALRADGEVVARAYSFQEDLVVLDTNIWQGDIRSMIGSDNPKSEKVARVLSALTMGVHDYVGKCGFKKCIIGLSGGIDSALTATIACQALGPDNVTGVALPSPYTSQESIDDAKLLAANLGCRFELISISALFHEFLETLHPYFVDLPKDVTEQNIQARIRGNLLMALSNKFNALLLSTGNKSEMAVGYCTLYGDMSGGLAVIADVPKMLVYDLAHFINRGNEIIPHRILEKAPTAELAPDQRDQDDLPPYEILDPILFMYLEENQGVVDIVRQGFDRKIVEDVVWRVNSNEYKRKQAPLGLKVTTKSFGYGRRYPTVQNYKESIS